MQADVTICTSMPMETLSNPVVERIFCGIRPAVVALIVVLVVNMLKKSGFKWGIVTLALLSAVAVWGFSVSPVWIMAVSGIIGVVYHTFIAQS